MRRVSKTFAVTMVSGGTLVYGFNTLTAAEIRREDEEVVAYAPELAEGLHLEQSAPPFDQIREQFQPAVTSGALSVDITSGYEISADGAVLKRWQV
jgi:hypothetical protein